MPIRTGNGERPAKDACLARLTALSGLQLERLLSCDVVHGRRSIQALDAHGARSGVLARVCSLRTLGRCPRCSWSFEGP